MTGGYELFVPVITTFNWNAVNPGTLDTLYWCSLKVISFAAGVTAVSGLPSSLSAVKLFFRVSSAEDVRKLGDVVWTAFNTDGTSDSIVPPSKNSVDFKEHKFSVTGLPEFTAFQLKIVLTGTNSSYPPLLKDMRGIALAI